MAESSASHAAGRRAVVNTALRAAAELVGKLGSFILFAALARTLGAEAVGQYVLAFAFVQIATILVDLGSDRLVIRRIALDHDSMAQVVADVLALKLALAVVVYGSAWGIAAALGYDATTQEAVRVLSLGLFLDSLNRTVASVFLARERGGLLSAAIIGQRLTGAVFGLGALAVGLGVIAICWTYAAGALLGLGVGLGLMMRHIGRPHLSTSVRRWPGLLRESAPFALQDSLTLVLTKIDTVLLSLLASSAAVAAYGGASRLYEASFFATYSLSGSFQAMFAYLTPDSDPPIGAIFERALKFSLVTLLPFAVAFATQAEDITQTFFGDELAASAGPLRLLAPSIVLMGIVSLGTVLVALRTGPAALVPLTFGILALNIVFNVVLIPEMGAEGAALAMSLSLACFSLVAVRKAEALAGKVRVARVAAAPFAGALAMAPVALFAGPWVLALALSGIAYAGVYVLVERRVAPDDLTFIVQLVKRQPAEEPTAAEAERAAGTTSP